MTEDSFGMMDSQENAASGGSQEASQEKAANDGSQPLFDEHR